MINVVGKRIPQVLAFQQALVDSRHVGIPDALGIPLDCKKCVRIFPVIVEDVRARRKCSVRIGKNGLDEQKLRLRASLADL